jgi:hypothetical protein
MPAIVPDAPTVEIAIVELTNAFRAENKLGAVKPNAALAAAARAYATYLANTGRFSHTADGRQAGERVQSTGYTWCQVGENLALHLDSRGFESRVLAKKSVEGWINSPHHRENMLAPHVTEIGVGVARAPGNEPKYISVQLFARPRSLQYEFQVSNTSQESVAYSFSGETHEVMPSFAVTHTACSPGVLSFYKVGAKAVSLRYEAADGVVFTLKPDKALGVRVDVSPRQKVK